MRVRIGTRASALARRQTDEVVRLWRERDPALLVEVLELSSVGDEHPDLPLERMEGIGFFTSTLERALLDGRIDVAVHSYKDLPVQETPGLAIVAVPRRGPLEDVLCARGGVRLADLDRGARIGTSSSRRIAQILARRPDLVCVPVRGNVPTRIERVTGGARAIRVRLEGTEPVALGAEAARRLLAQGAGEILAELERAPRVAWEART